MSAAGISALPPRRTGFEPGRRQTEPDTVYNVRLLLPVVYRREYHRELLGRLRYIRQATV